MPVPSDAVGARTAPFTHTVDARWVMAYAAGLRDLNPAYLDTERPGGVVAHPLFPVCVEWPVVLAVRALPPLEEHVTHAEARRGVHATHDLDVLPRIADRCVVFSEEHRIVAEGAPEEVLADRDLLLSVNLIHPGSRLP